MSIFSISIILLVILIYVFARPKPDIISVNLVSETNEITYSDSESVQIFEDAIRTVKKYAGLLMWVHQLIE